MFQKPISTAVLLLVILLTAPGLAQDEKENPPIFSGPQVGEKLAPFKVRGVLDELAGKEIDLITNADGKPVAILFLHKLTRPSVAVTRTVMDYAAKRAKDGLVSGVIFLGPDATALETRIKRARHALPQKTPIAVSLDGQEGPGAYGLNRDVILTVLVGNEGKVTANFAIVQPSVQVDAVKIAKAITDVAGGKPPTLAQLGGGRYRRGRLQMLIRPMIQKEASKDDVDKAAKTIEEFIANRPAQRRQLGQIATRVVNSGRLETYGTPPAQEYIRKWAKQYGPPKQPKQPKKDR